MSVVLDVKSAVVRRDGHEILQGISWSVRENERWVVLGPNGAGKTTLMRLLGGRLHPSEGTVTVLGNVLGHVDLNELYPLVGLTSSAMDSYIPPDERVIDVVRTAAYGHLASWKDEFDAEDNAQAYALMQKMHVEHLRDRTFGSLSSGERKRVGVCRALMPDPEILLLDEPTSGLDLGGREELVLALSQLAQSPFAPALVLVTHHVEEIPAGFTHALLIEQGHVFAAGPINEVLTSDNLSILFGIPINLNRLSSGRFIAEGKQL